MPEPPDLAPPAPVPASTPAAPVVLPKDPREEMAQRNSPEQFVFFLGCLVIGGAALTMIAVLAGCFVLITGKIEVNEALLAVCTGLIGSVLGYASSSAQQIISYYFGYTKGREELMARRRNPPPPS